MKNNSLPEITFKAFFLSIILSSNNSLIELYINDAPVWSEFEPQSIDEDCESGCDNGEFIFDLEPYVSDIDDDQITILDPVLMLGEAEVSVSSFILSILSIISILSIRLFSSYFHPIARQ